MIGIPRCKWNGVLCSLFGWGILLEELIDLTDWESQQCHESVTNSAVNERRELGILNFQLRVLLLQTISFI